MTKSVVIIGASGRLGKQLVTVGAKHASKPAIHAFLRSPEKLTDEEKSLCASVQQGDGLKKEDVSRILTETKADVVVISLGVVGDLKPQTLREDNAKVMMSLVKPGAPFENVRVICISSIGAGGTKIKMGLGMGMLVTNFIKHPLKDHDHQEEVFLSEFGEKKDERLVIVRPTGLGDGKPTGNIVTFDPDKKPPTARIDRADVAKFVFEHIANKYDTFGGIFNVTTGRN